MTNKWGQYKLYSRYELQLIFWPLLSPGLVFSSGWHYQNSTTRQTSACVRYFQSDAERRGFIKRHSGQSAGNDYTCLLAFLPRPPFPLSPTSFSPLTRASPFLQHPVLLHCRKDSPLQREKSLIVGRTKCDE